MKILIIGSIGFIGSHLYDFFSKQGEEVYGCDIIPASPHPNYLPVNNLTPAYESIFKEHSFDVCINASGSASVAFSIENAQKDYLLNVVNVEKILKAVTTYNPDCKFINFSSAAVYGNPKTLPIKETASLLPISPYGRHKKESEDLLRDYYHKYKVSTLSLRIFSAFGPDLKKQLFWDIYTKIAHSNNGHITLYGTGNETRDFIFISDIASALAHLIKKADFKGEAINIASGCETSIRQASALFIKYFNPDTFIEFIGQKKEGDPDNWVADISILKQHGFVTTLPFEEGVKKYAEWLKGKK